jgi:hypothetical protein
MTSSIQPLAVSQSFSGSQGIQAPGPKPTTPHSGSAQGFRELFEKIAASPSSKDPFSNNLHKELGALQQKALGGGAFDARELLLYQIKAGQFNMRVELVSKVAESLLGTLRKLQSQP